MELSDRFLNAFTYAFEIHKEPRKGTRIPVISHLIGVAAIALEQGGTEDEAIAAILHDAVEDKGGKERLEDIRSKFGEKVATIVDGCTDSYTNPKEDWWPRKEEYIAHLPESDPSVRLVSAADKLHNARLILEHYRDVGDKLWDRFKGGKEGTLWYYRTLTNTFQKTGPHKLANELDRVVSEIEQLAR